MANVLKLVMKRLLDSKKVWLLLPDCTNETFLSVGPPILVVAWRVVAAVESHHTNCAFCVWCMQGRQRAQHQLGGLRSHDTTNGQFKMVQRNAAQ